MKKRSKKKTVRRRSNPKTISGPRGSGLKAIYSPVNQAWLLMWKDQVLRVLNTRAEVKEEIKDLVRGTSVDPRKKNPRARKNSLFGRSVPLTLTGSQIKKLMSKHKRRIADVASDMDVTQKRVRQVRKSGVSGQNFIRDWIQGIVGEDPGYISKETIAELLKKKKRNPCKGRRRSNSARARKRSAPLLKLGMLPVIGDRVLTIDYQGGEGKDPASKWTHDFSKVKAKVYGLPDGSLLIKGAKRLWRMFK